MKQGIILKKQTEDGFSFDLLAPDALVLCRSRLFANDEECLEAIERVRRNCGAPIEEGEAENCPRYAVYQKEDGAFSFRLMDENGQALIYGPDFAVAYTARKGIRAVAKYAPGATVIIPTHTGTASTGQALNI